MRIYIHPIPHIRNLYHHKLVNKKLPEELYLSYVGRIDEMERDQRELSAIMAKETLTHYVFTRGNLSHIEEREIKTILGTLNEVYQYINPIIIILKLS